jgi:hypothetical protein
VVFEKKDKDEGDKTVDPNDDNVDDKSVDKPRFKLFLLLVPCLGEDKILGTHLEGVTTDATFPLAFGSVGVRGAATDMGRA